MDRLPVGGSNRSDTPRPSARRTRLGRSLPWLVCAALGALVVIDGAASPEVRHRAVAFLLGGLGFLPLAVCVVFGARGEVWVRKAALACGSLLVALAAVEVIARRLEVSALAPVAYAADPVLGRVHLPRRGAIDAWGFRNAAVPQRADVVCLGDSQTYGENLRREQAYPARIAERTGRSVYNMSLGGYGPLQMWALMDRALSLEPQTLVFGFYPGNDLVDAHRFAALDHWRDLRDPALAYATPTELLPRDERSANLALAVIDGAVARSWTLARLTHDLKLLVKSTPALARMYGQGDTRDGYDGGTIRTLFSPDLRFGTVDLERPEVRDGLRITAIALRAIAARCEAKGVRAVLLVIPTKERVYHAHLAAVGAAEAALVARVSAAEVDVTARVVAEARGLGMTVVDPTDALVRELGSGTALWPHGRDGHLGPAGSDVVAEVLCSGAIRDSRAVAAEAGG